MSRLFDARSALKMSQAELADKVQTTQSQIQRLEKGKRKLDRDWAHRLAPHLNVTVEYLLGEGSRTSLLDTTASRAVTLVPVRGRVAAGAWMAHDDLADEIDIPALPRTDGLEQFAFRIEGTSMNAAGLLDGWYVVCVPYWQAREAFTPNDTVVVERRQGGLVERTCKVVQLTPTHYELAPRSTDPRWQQPIRIPRGLTEPEDGVEIEVVGLVVWKCAPVG